MSTTNPAAPAHTPGPWTVEKLEWLSDVHPVCIVAGGRPIADLPWLLPEETERQMADAHLIAAAPDLMAALQPFVMHSSSEEMITITVRTADIHAARIAIARAEGREVKDARSEQRP